MSKDARAHNAHPLTHAYNKQTGAPPLRSSFLLPYSGSGGPARWWTRYANGRSRQTLGEQTRNSCTREAEEAGSREATALCEAALAGQDMRLSS